MAQKPVKYFFVSSGDLLPLFAPSFKMGMWDHWKDEGISRFKLAKPYIESIKPEGNVSVDCAFDNQKMSIIIDDALTSVEEQPLEFSIGLSGFGATFGKYLTARRGNPRVDADTNDRQRREAHDQMAARIVKGLKKAGLFFEDEDRARDAFRSLTAYWFDLLEEKGLLVPQQGRATPSKIPAPRRKPGGKPEP